MAEPDRSVWPIRAERLREFGFQRDRYEDYETLGRWTGAAPMETALSIPPPSPPPATRNGLSATGFLPGELRSVLEKWL